MGIHNPRWLVVAACALAVVLALSGGVARSPAAGGASDSPGAQKEIPGLVGAFERATRATVGVSVVDLRTDAATPKRVLSLRETEKFAPASNQKILTSAFALARLGGDFKFVTRAYLVGESLWVFGSGDPTLGDPRLADEASATIYDELDRWAKLVGQRVGQKLPGDVVAVPSFSGEAARLESFRHDDWPKDQYHRWYLAPVAGLNFNDNCFDVTFTVSGDEVTAQVEPVSRWIRIVNEVRKGRRHLWSLRSNEDDSVVTLQGTALRTAREPLSVPVNNPPLLLARVLADRLQRAGVAVGGSVRVANAAPAGFDPATAEEICRTVTPLAVAMIRANKRSLNLAAECIMLRAGDGTWAGSAKLMAETLVKSYGLRSEDLVVRDGCGLSDANRVTPAAVTTVLAKVLKRSDSGLLVDSLALAGVDGTLRNRMEAAATRGRIRGKTGYIAGVSCLSGYVLDAAGKPALAYSILVNRCSAAWRAKQLEDRICTALVAMVGK